MRRQTFTAKGAGKMTTRTLPLPGLRKSGRRDWRAPRPMRQRDPEGTSFGRLLGFAVLGWFGLMVVVTAIAL